MGQLAPILQRRTPVVHLMGPDQLVSDAARHMSRNHVGVVTIVENRQLVGVFSERDLLRRGVAQGKQPDKTLLRDVMTPDPVTATRQEDRQSAIRKMRTVGCRHLPIVQSGVVIDMLSMRDLLADALQERASDIEALRDYIHGHY